jgi:hypothetical protein
MTYWKCESRLHLRSLLEVTEFANVQYRHVKNLVGEIDFSYRAVKSSSLSTVSSSTDDSDNKSKDD